MANKELKLISADKMVRELTFQYTTDEVPKPTLTKVVVTMKDPFNLKKDGKAVFTSSTIPKTSEIGAGKTFKLNSQLLGVTDFYSSYLTFKDGVQVCYGADKEVLSVTGVKGNNYLIGTGLQPILESYDSVILPNNDVLQLDKSKPTNGGTVLYFLSDLTQDVTSFNPAWRTTVKLKNDFRTKAVLCKVVHILGSDYRSKIDEKENAVQKLIRNKMTADLAWEMEDYDLVDQLLKENIRIGEWLGVIRGGEIWI